MGADVSAVASAAGMSKAALQAELAHDKDLGYDKKSKRLLYACESLLVNGTAAAASVKAHSHSHRRSLRASSALPGDPDPADTSLAFQLHSRPGASKIILLDFDGHITTGKVWNSAFTGGSTITTPPYSTDADPAFSNTELLNIIAIWRAVAEDFAAFDVDVTTEDRDPATNAPWNLSGRGIRAAIGGSSNDWYGAGAGGVAYVNVFGNTNYEPAFVFPAQLGSGTAKYVWEATSHELGHNMGLSHDGTSTAGYYSCHNGWAPIMGVGYYQPLSQWSKGEYADAKTTQDDLAIIASKVGYRADDHGDSAATATALAGPGAPTTGNIERTGDVDWFTFNAAAGTASLTLALAPAYGGQARSNVDVRVQVFPACSYVPLATWDPSTGLFAGTQSTTLPAQGTYYVTVQGVGQGADASTGYSNYGSLGEYKLSVSYTAASAGYVSAACAPFPPAPPPPSPKPPPPRICSAKGAPCTANINCCSNNCKLQKGVRLCA
ncbi:putative Chi [Micractinium conductrix]|uniref:Chi n=1 Tax=Micractinium conductrix TaxID=554055 RepID=A0A2P6VQS6_9CHLO|nr:putative Chi [Micractinium conductrix]|eukprot:PSC76442.1 putative Chi [Micractinium conductrix]